MRATGSRQSCHSRRPAVDLRADAPELEAVWGGSVHRRMPSERGAIFRRAGPRAPAAAHNRARTTGAAAMNERRFEGKVALVTGGNSGIGLAVATRACRRRRARRHRRSQRRDGRAPRRRRWARRRTASSPTRRASTTSIASIAATREFGGGRLDVVFANAGVGAFGPLATISEADVGPSCRHQRQGRLLHGAEGGAADGQGGAIVLNASVAAGKGNPGGSVYAASKAAVRSFGRTSAPSSSSAASASTSSARGRSRRRSSSGRMDEQQVAGAQGGDGRRATR